MLVHDDIFHWEGFGGRLKLAAGRCRLRIFDLSRGGRRDLAHIKPIIVVVSDLPEDTGKLKRLGVRSCASHIATRVSQKFAIDHQRMIFIEFYPEEVYGNRKQHRIAERFDTVDFTWFDDKALHPKWRPAPAALVETIKSLMPGKSFSAV
jgi:hypothetical protein